MRSLKYFVFLLCLAASCALAQTAPSNTAAQIALHSQKAQQYLRDKQPKLAIPELKAVVRLDPDNLDAEANLGVLLYFQGDYAGANEALRKALALHPDIPKLQALLGMSEERSGDPQSAVKDLAAAFPQLRDQKIQMEAGMSLIHLYQAHDRLAEAANIVRQLQTLQPKNPQLIYVAYRLYSDLAGEQLLSLSLVAPDSAQMHAAMAYEDTIQDNNQAAIEQYRKVLAIDPKLPGAEFALAQLLQNANDVKQQQEAASIYEAALRENPYDEPSAVALGEMNLTQGNFKIAQTYYERALKIDPEDAEANFGLAKALIGTNQSKQALPYLEKSIRLDPTDASAHFRLATLYRQEGREQEARQQLVIFQRLRKLKDKLSDLYKQMRMQPAHQENHHASQGGIAGGQ
jgi:tetratricopeptide (TPR) repeat protein